MRKSVRIKLNVFTSILVFSILLPVQRYLLQNMQIFLINLRVLYLKSLVLYNCRQMPGKTIKLQLLFNPEIIFNKRLTVLKAKEGESFISRDL